MKNKDTLFSKPLEKIKAFEFDNNVAEVFDDMISRSVPLYNELQKGIADLIIAHCHPNMNLYDLGCSTGTTLKELAPRLQEIGTKIIGIDNSPAMIEKCHSKLQEYLASSNIELRTEDLTETKLENACAVIMNYTLQFIAPESRAEMIGRIYRGLNNKGVLLLTEKVNHKNQYFHKLLIDVHHNFKKRNGYSDLEIAQKRDSIENVLIPLSTEENIEMLKRAGFENIEVVFKLYNFVTIIAVKN